MFSDPPPYRLKEFGFPSRLLLWLEFVPLPAVLRGGGGGGGTAGDDLSFRKLFVGLALRIELEAEGWRRGGGGGIKGLASEVAGSITVVVDMDVPGGGCTIRVGGGRGGGSWETLLTGLSSCLGTESESTGSGTSVMDSCVLIFEALRGRLEVAACLLDAGGGGGSFFGVDRSSSGVGTTECPGKLLSGTAGGGTVPDMCCLPGAGGSGLLRSLTDRCIDGLRIPLC